MKFRSLVIICALLFLLAPLNRVCGQDPTKYTVQINSDNSAMWKVTQVVDIEAPIDTLTELLQKVITLVDAAANSTQRQMTIDENSLQMDTRMFWETRSKTVEYAFVWENFSLAENGKITFGDVFQVENFFHMLYGDGALQIIYPSTYHVETVTPPPNEQDADIQTLEWLGTQYFVNGQPSITLISESQSQSSEGWQTAAVILGLASIVIAFVVSIYLFKRSRREIKETLKTEGLPSGLVESEEEKILKVLRSSGGSLRQSAITEQCNFSKAKTSQLLAILEQKGVVRRYKKGRDKIVTLAESSNR